ncbi:MAG: class A beta-lactamase-related serine hydrolase [Flavobacteriales bacterium]|nr:class A beta-lactamase-related serine hydrolase [Flavobacteriales bacterium]
MKIHFLLINLLFLTVLATAQVEKSSELYKSIKAKDSLLFNLGFNKCDMNQFENLVSESFKFYHDKAGIVKSKSEFISNIKSSVCNIEYKAIRKLDSTKTEIYPLHNNTVLYGAIQNGVHSFYSLEENSKEYLTSIAKFTHVWILENGKWKLSKGLSYDHKDFDKPINQELLFKDKDETEKWLKQKNIPALGIGYIEDGKIKQINVFGELEKGRKAPKNTIWNVASLTKPIVTLITLKLVSNGNWSLDEPIYHYWIDPDVKNDDRYKTLTTRHILSHQTGFSNWRWFDKESENKLTFHFNPGTNYQYSGEGYEYLKKALENKFKISLEKLADSLIFKPLKMKDTRFYWNKKMDESRFAKWHTAGGELYDTYKNNNVSAADDLLTTIEDYTKFILYIINGAELSESLQKEMSEEQVRINSSKYWGLGFWIDENINKNGDITLVHGGDDIGVHTIAFMLPKTKQGLIIFTNSDNGTEAFQEVLLKYLEENGQGIIEVEMK